jgi:hypothetical protein
MLRPTVQSASPSCNKVTIWGLRPDFYFYQTAAVCWCGAPSLTRGRVCRLQLLLVLASAVIFGSESRGTHDHILLSQIRDSPTLEGHVPVFISPRNRVAQLYSQALGSLFVALYDSQGCGGVIRTLVHTWSSIRTPSPNLSCLSERVWDRVTLRLAIYRQSELKPKPKSHCDWRSVNQ